MRQVKSVLACYGGARDDDCFKIRTVANKRYTPPCNALGRCLKEVHSIKGASYGRGLSNIVKAVVVSTTLTLNL